jgi:hypothetical protein
MPQKSILDKKKPQKNFSFRKHSFACLPLVRPDDKSVAKSVLKYAMRHFMRIIFIAKDNLSDFPQ